MRTLCVQSIICHKQICTHANEVMYVLIYDFLLSPIHTGVGTSGSWRRARTLHSLLHLRRQKSHRAHDQGQAWEVWHAAKTKTQVTHARAYITRRCSEHDVGETCACVALNVCLWETQKGYSCLPPIKWCLVTFLIDFVFFWCQNSGPSASAAQYGKSVPHYWLLWEHNRLQV